MHGVELVSCQQQPTLPVAAQEGQGYETSIGGVWLGRPLDEALLVRFLASLPADARPEGVDARDLEVTCNGTIVDRTARVGDLARLGSPGEPLELVLNWGGAGWSQA